MLSYLRGPGLKGAMSPNSFNFAYYLPGNVLPVPLQKLVGEFLVFYREIWREFCRTFLTHKAKAQKFGTFLECFPEEIS